MTAAEAMRLSNLLANYLATFVRLLGFPSPSRQTSAAPRAGTARRRRSASNLDLNWGWLTVTLNVCSWHKCDEATRLAWVRFLVLVRDVCPPGRPRRILTQTGTFPR